MHFYYIDVKSFFDLAQKIEENQPALKSNFRLKYKCTSHDFEFGV